MNLKMIGVVALGGAIGSVLRFMLMSGIGHFWKSHFPLSTLVVNVLGSFAIGALVEILMQHQGSNLLWRGFFIVGVLGGFTTFSTFALDAGLLIEKEQLFLAGLYLSGSVIISILAFFAGMALFR